MYNFDDLNVKMPGTFDNLSEDSLYHHEVLYKKISNVGQKMYGFYYHLLLKDVFLNGAERHFYKNPEDKFFGNLFLKEENDYVYFSKCGDEDIIDNNFNYRINNYSFRSDHFEKMDNNNYNILTNGCSVTFGMGLPEDNIWPNLLKEKIKTKKENKVFNLGVTGIDTFRLINNFYTFINLFGKPDVFFMLLPPIYRFANLDEKNRKISSLQSVSWLPDSNAIERLMMKNDNKYIIDIFYNISAIRNLETFCKNTGIDLFWFSWDQASQEYYEIFEFDNLIHNVNFMFENIKNDNQLTYWDIARDNSHFGLKKHYKFAEIFYREGLRHETWL